MYTFVDQDAILRCNSLPILHKLSQSSTTRWERWERWERCRKTCKAFGHQTSCFVFHNNNKKKKKKKKERQTSERKEDDVYECVRNWLIKYLQTPFARFWVQNHLFKTARSKRDQDADGMPHQVTDQGKIHMRLTKCWRVKGIEGSKPTKTSSKWRFHGWNSRIRTNCGRKPIPKQECVL